MRCQLVLVNLLEAFEGKDPDSDASSLRRLKLECCRIVVYVQCAEVGAQKGGMVRDASGSLSVP